MMNRWSVSKRPGGFTLVEIMVVVVIISFLAMLAVPAFIRVKRHSVSAAISNDFRVFSAAFETYAQEHGSWPPTAAPGVIPTGMEQLLSKSGWTRTTPMGGKYTWETDQLVWGTKYKAIIMIQGTADAPLPFDLAQIQDLDQMIDNGDGFLMKGNFQIGQGFAPVYVIQP